MLGPIQRQWLLDTIAGSQGRFLVLCSPVPWVYEAKGDSRDTWNGFREERTEIFDALAEGNRQGVLLMSADRHRSDLWKIERPNGYPLYEFNSSRLTNQHVHKEMQDALFSYNKTQSFGTVDFDTTRDDPEVTYRIWNIAGEEVNAFTVRLSQLGG
jgi:alkaline phosphatase D